MPIAPRVDIAVAAGPQAQQAAVDAWLERYPVGARLILAEGALWTLQAPAALPLIRLAAGCVCCVGAVALRVNLTSAIRAARPDRVLLLITDPDHLASTRKLVVDLGLVVC